MTTKECDLLVIGGGPAGLSAAINGSSEGLKVVLIDSGPELGGQAVLSSSIENFPGFPEGISGRDLLGRFIFQATKFQTEILCPQTAVSIRADGAQRIVTTDDEQVFSAKVVILSLGLSYKKLGVPGIGALLGRGVLYGPPTVHPSQLGECNVCVIGGANSAGQAVMHLATNNEKAKIKMLVRRTINIDMSQYLVDRVRQASNVEILEGTEVTEFFGNGKLERVAIKRRDGSTGELPTDHLFIFIGASPKTFWLQGSLGLDDKKFILTGSRATKELGWPADLIRAPLPFETTIPGVFACGDVRYTSTKRVGSAVGEGTSALAMCHEYLRLTNGH